MRDRYPFETKLPKTLLLRKTAHFHLYYYPASTAEKEIESIAAQREKAYADIADFLNTTASIPIDLYLFPDAETKEQETHHRGAGWAFDTVMVEIYSETVKCHPYHELVHVFADLLYGTTVSCFSEGLAVFVSEHAYDRDFGDSVNYNTDEKVKEFYKEGRLFSLKDLFSLQIGESSSIPPISYPQAASLIGYLYETLGKAAFFALYRDLQDVYSAEGVAQNIATFESHLGASIEQVNRDWLASISG